MKGESAQKGASPDSPEVTSKRSKRRKTKGNSLYVHRPAFERHLMLIQSFAPQGSAMGVLGTYSALVVLCTDDPDGVIRWSEGHIIKRLGVSRTTWRVHRDILLSADLLRKTGQHSTNQHGSVITFEVPDFSDLRGLAGSVTDPPDEDARSVAGSAGGSAGGSDTDPAQGVSPAPLRPDYQDPQDPQDHQDGERASRDCRDNPWVSLGGVGT